MIRAIYELSILLENTILSLKFVNHLKVVKIRFLVINHLELILRCSCHSCWQGFQDLNVGGFRSLGPKIWIRGSLGMFFL